MPERRDRMRIPLESAVSLRYETGRRSYPGRVENISAEGILVTTEEAFPPGRVVSFEIVPTPEHPRATPLEGGKFRVQRAEGVEPPFEIAGILLERSPKGSEPGADTD